MLPMSRFMQLYYSFFSWMLIDIVVRASERKETFLLFVSAFFATLCTLIALGARVPSPNHAGDRNETED